MGPHTWLSLGIEWDHHERDAPRSDDTQHLAHRPPVIWNVWEHVHAKHHVEARIGQVEVGEIEADHSFGFIRVAGEVSELRLFPEKYLQALSRGDVEETERLGESFKPFAPQVEPKESRTSRTATARAIACRRLDERRKDRPQTGQETPVPW